MTPVFPADVVTWRSPAKERALFRRTLAGIRWTGKNAMVMLAIARARLWPRRLEPGDVCEDLVRMNETWPATRCTARRWNG